MPARSRPARAALDHQAELHASLVNATVQAKCDQLGELNGLDAELVLSSGAGTSAGVAEGLKLSGSIVKSTTIVGQVRWFGSVVVASPAYEQTRPRTLRSSQRTCRPEVGHRRRPGAMQTASTSASLVIRAKTSHTLVPPCRPTTGQKEPDTPRWRGHRGHTHLPACPQPVRSPVSLTPSCVNASAANVALNAGPPRRQMTG